jgi:hypothetical protein
LIVCACECGIRVLEGRKHGKRDSGEVTKKKIVGVEVANDLEGQSSLVAVLEARSSTPLFAAIISSTRNTCL